jgi:cytochrome c-type biogenesis protein CcmH/NrfG
VRATPVTMNVRSWRFIGLALALALVVVALTMTDAWSGKGSTDQCARPVSERVGGWTCPSR